MDAMAYARTLELSEISNEVLLMHTKIIQNIFHKLDNSELQMGEIDQCLDYFYELHEKLGESLLGLVP